MQVYLPVAEISVNIFLLLGLGGLIGVLSGIFGVGGGFLMTPMLIVIGIPPAVAVATEANQIVASSFSGALAHLKRRTVDLRMGTVLLVGGLLLFKTATPVLEETADTLLRNLSLLFVPAAVGVIQHGAVLKAHGTAIVLALVLSTIATLAVTALVFAAVSRRMAGGTGGEATNGEDPG